MLPHRGVLRTEDTYKAKSSKTVSPLPELYLHTNATTAIQQQTTIVNCL